MTNTSGSKISMAIKMSLETKGTWNKYKAILRKDVFEFLQNEGLPKNMALGDTKVREMNKFITEYLKQQGLLNTLAVFEAESGS